MKALESVRLPLEDMQNCNKGQQHVPHLLGLPKNEMPKSEVRVVRPLQFIHLLFPTTLHGTKTLHKTNCLTMYEYEFKNGKGEILHTHGVVPHDYAPIQQCMYL